MNTALADGTYYFGENGFPLMLLRVQTDQSPSHPHDLTEVEHRHDFCELVIVTEGSAMHALEGEEFPVAAGDVFLLQGRQRHHFHSRENLKLINVMYDPVKLSLPENELRRIPGYSAMFILEPNYRRQHRFASRLHLGRMELTRVEGLADEMERECNDDSPGRDVLLRVKLMEMIVYLSRAYSSSTAVEAQALLRVGHVIGALENDFSKDWKLEELLDISHMSRSTLMRTFRKATGRTPIEYLVRLRIQRAAELLRTEDLSVTEVAFQVGFNDSNYFARQFRRVLGESPSNYRRRHVAAAQE